MWSLRQEEAPGIKAGTQMVPAVHLQKEKTVLIFHDTRVSECILRAINH